MKIIISKNLTQKKKAKQLNLLVGQCLQNFHLMKKKINLVIVGEIIVLKNLKRCAIKIIIHGKKRNDTIDL